MFHTQWYLHATINVHHGYALHHRRVGSRENGIGYTIRRQILEEKYHRTSITEIK